MDLECRVLQGLFRKGTYSFGDPKTALSSKIAHVVKISDFDGLLTLALLPQLWLDCRVDLRY